MLGDNLELALYVPRDLEDLEDLEVVVPLLRRVHELVPEYAPESLLESLSREEGGERRPDIAWREQRIEGEVIGVTFQLAGFCKLGIRDLRPVTDAQAAARVLVDLAQSSSVRFGFVHRPSWAEEDGGRTVIGGETWGRGTLLMGGAGGRGLMERMPNLYWLTLIGPAFASAIGEETIMTTPVERVWKVAEETFALQLTPSIPATDAEFSVLLERRAEARRHLGQQYFFTPA